MAKKKKGQRDEVSGEASARQIEQELPLLGTASKQSKASGKSNSRVPPTPTLVICRNKHWRYISSFHGPWLQLPPEVLESLAHSNYFSSRPRPIDPAVFFNLVKIRKAVDDATTLAVRAASGLTSATLSNSVNAGNGMMGGASAAALGLVYGGGGATAKLSRERKHRMRELATQKLSHAYHLDEIATSVATMQSTSTLEDLAQLVLQRNAVDSDAKYVHFFHEKIPSRMMAQCTSLEPLDQIIVDRPTDAAPLRTRALTRIFKEDYAGAVKDLSEALTICRYTMAQHRAGKDQLVLARSVQEDVSKRYGGDWRQEARVEEEDQPSSLEPQLLFHRAGVYFTIACRHASSALNRLREERMTEPQVDREGKNEPKSKMSHSGEVKEGIETQGLEDFKAVKTNAKRALKDYMSFLSHFDYTPGVQPLLADDLPRTDGSFTTESSTSPSTPQESSLNLLKEPEICSSEGMLSSKIQPYQHLGSSKSSLLTLHPPTIHPVSSLFLSSPPHDLPPYPPETSTMPNALSFELDESSTLAEAQEGVTYHPLLTDALHSLLLCHALLQTSPKELQRHAHNAARIARVCDGYPVFLAARSPARADWVEVLRRAGNWIGLQQSWEALCRPAPLPGQQSFQPAPTSDATALVSAGSSAAKDQNGQREVQPTQTEAQKRERQKQEVILEALADERVVDEESFQRAVRAREHRALEDEIAKEKVESTAESSVSTEMVVANGVSSPSHTLLSSPTGQESSIEEPTSKKIKPQSSQAATHKTSSKPASSSSKRWAQDDWKDFSIITERAEAVAHWVLEAPQTIDGGGKSKKTKRRKGGTRIAKDLDTISNDEASKNDDGVKADDLGVAAGINETVPEAVVC